MEFSGERSVKSLRSTNVLTEKLELDCIVSSVTLKMSTLTVSSNVKDRISDDRLREKESKIGLVLSSMYVVTGSASSNGIGTRLKPVISSTPFSVMDKNVLFSVVARL